MLAAYYNGFGDDTTPASTDTSSFDPTALVTGLISQGEAAVAAAASTVSNGAQCAAVLAPVAAEAQWSIKRPRGAAIAVGGGIAALIIGVMIGKHHGGSHAVSGRRRRY